MFFKFKAFSKDTEYAKYKLTIYIYIHIYAEYAAGFERNQIENE